jgi:hypothetical protein
VSEVESSAAAGGGPPDPEPPHALKDSTAMSVVVLLSHELTGAPGETR